MTEKAKQSCSISGCKRTYRAKNYCDFHFKKWRKGELPHAPYKTCVQQGCRKKIFKSVMCEEHYQAKYGKKAGSEAAASAPAAVAASPAPAPEATPAA